MVVKESFILLKDIPNILRMHSPELKKYSIDRGQRKVSVILELNKNKIKHFTTEKVFSMINDLEKRKRFVVVNIPDYNLYVSYNLPTKQIVLNLSAYNRNIDDIYSTEPDPKDLYTQLVYGILFSHLVTGNIKIKESYFAPISNFFLSMIIGLFGKEYGLLGTYSSLITGLNFLTNCYILSSFFGITGKKAYKMAAAVSAYDYKVVEDQLDKYDFSNIEQFILSLSELKIMPGIDKYSFTNRFFRATNNINFLPALEDFSRFIGVMTCISMKGSNLIPTYLSKYNEDSFNRIIEITKLVFK
jgi:hypothetical protein